jgi:hypothetical protein
MGMTRRAFVASAGGGALALGLGVGPGLTAASEPRAGRAVGPPLGPEEERFLGLAALAPSSHNTQPWAVVVEAKDRLVVAVDPARRLAAVDPDGREAILSLGAFLENLVQAARAGGRQVTLEATSSGGEPAFHVHLEPCTPDDRAGDVARIEHRRTLRKGYRSEALTPSDRDVLLAAAGAATFAPAGSKEARWLVEAAVESFRKQTWRDDAQAELAGWIRFSGAEIDRRRDGLTPATMEIGGFAGFWASHFMDQGSVTGKRFREAGIDATAAQAGEGAGFIVITSPDGSVANLVDAGRRFERMALLLGERKLAAHPMSSLLEEAPWSSEAARETGVDGLLQFVLRVGHVDRQPPPVSPRRHVSDFTRVGQT